MLRRGGKQPQKLWWRSLLANILRSDLKAQRRVDEPDQRAASLTTNLPRAQEKTPAFHSVPPRSTAASVARTKRRACMAN
jgi:hypothetical protein